MTLFSSRKVSTIDRVHCLLELKLLSLAYFPSSCMTYKFILKLGDEEGGGCPYTKANGGSGEVLTQRMFTPGSTVANM